MIARYAFHYHGELRALEPASARCVTCAVWSSIGALSWMNARH
jgi:hypothetical protein